MESNYIIKSRLYNLQRLIYFNRYKIVLQRTNRNKQRLIPLTREIQKAMMDFNGSQSNSSVSETPYNKLSITNLVRDEVFNILRDLSISDQFIRKEDIDVIIDKCLNERVAIIQNCDAKVQHLILDDANEEFEITVEEIREDRDKNKLIVENIQMMEQRITTLETRLSSMIQNIPKLRHLRAKRFKVNINANKEQLDTLYKVDTQSKLAKPIEKSTLSKDVRANKVISPPNIYDYIFYTTRQYNLNSLNYKKSLRSIELNQKPKWNPYIKPMNIILPPVAGKFKQRSLFLTTNEICMG